MDWLDAILTGSGATFAAKFIKELFTKKETKAATEKKEEATDKHTSIVINNTNTVGNLSNANTNTKSDMPAIAEVSVANLAADDNRAAQNVSMIGPDVAKALVKILFIDDDTRFKVIKILKTAGWINTKLIKDVASLDQPNVVEAHILFVDINGVGKLLDFKDEGLGLALRLKQRYPDKKVVIYSAQTTGAMFHDALRKADGVLPKDAEPYEFQKLVDDFSREIKF